MLTSIVLHLQAQADGRISGGTGRAVHGFWLNQWRQVAPQVAAALHQSNGVQPFTLSPLMALPAPRRGQTAIAAGAATWLRIAVLHPSLSRQLLETWLPRLPAHIELAGIPWRIQQICLSPQEHPWAGQTTYQTLVRKHLGAAEPPHQWRLTFATPTAFHSSRDVHLPFPLPDALVASWQRRWQAFSPHPLADQPLADNLRSRLRDHLLVSAYDLKTVPARYGRRLAIGCVGQMALHAKKLNPGERAAISLLADYAFFTGSGSHTTQGMGMTIGD